MSSIFNMMMHWTPIGQGIFMLIVLGMILTFMQAFIHYITILVRGWPK